MDQGDESAVPLGMSLSVHMTQQNVQKQPANEGAACLD